MPYCAEFNSINCAKVLFKFNADINAKADIDEYGFGGQTPVFHTVNQNNNDSPDMMNFLIENGADLTITIRGII
jgi:ankyrin repeat protein